MRAIFGLGALLVAVGIMFYVFTKNTAETLKVAKPMQEQAQQMSGRGQDGVGAEHSFQCEPVQRGTRLDALLVTAVTPGGAADTFYGLKKGDKIISISTSGGLQKVNDASNGDAEMAKAMLAQYSFSASQPIVVERNGQQLTLPASAAPAVTNAPDASPSQSQAQAQPAQTPNQPPPERGNVHSQVENIIKGIPGQH
ncbi:MAG TPA: hypothetical protein VGI81_09745 [Tepidisphaeraceae bacterium]|jgi:hypothetical protein